MTEASELFASTIAMGSSGFLGARNVNRTERAAAPIAGSVYIRARARQSGWPMFARFSRVAVAAERPSEVSRAAMTPATTPAVARGAARAATAASAGVSSVSPGTTFSLAPSGAREETSEPANQDNGRGQLSGSIVAGGKYFAAGAARRGDVGAEDAGAGRAGFNFWWRAESFGCGFSRNQRG